MEKLLISIVAEFSLSGFILSSAFNLVNFYIVSSLHILTDVNKEE